MVVGHGERGQERLKLPPGGVAAKSERKKEKAQAKQGKTGNSRQETSMSKTHQLMAADRSVKGDSRRKAQAEDPGDPRTRHRRRR